MTEHLLDRRPVRYQDTVKPHLLPQDLAHQPPVSRRRNTVDRIKSCHHQRRPGLDPRLICRQIKLAQRMFRQLNRVVVTPRIRRTVPCKMLDAGSYAPRLSQILPLVSPHHCGRIEAVQIWILARRFHHAPPARVPHQICHGRKGHMHSADSRFLRRHPGTPHGQLRLKGRPLSQRYRKHCPVSIDDVEHEQQRNLMRMLFHVSFLYPFCRVCP